MRWTVVAVLATCTVISSAPAAFAQCAGGYAPTCSLTKAAPIVFLGTIESISDGTFHFRVEEGFAGVNGSTIDVVDIAPVEGSTGYAESEKRYLVFAQSVRYEDGSRHAQVKVTGKASKGTFKLAS